VDADSLSSGIYRLLKPEGSCFVSTPFCWHYHPWPNDYWRFTAEGLAVLFEAFSECRIDQDCNTSQTLLQEFGFLLVRAGFDSSDFLPVLNHLGASPDIISDDNLPAHHLVWLRK
jgi:hypothetical protein